MERSAMRGQRSRITLALHPGYTLFAIRLPSRGLAAALYVQFKPAQAGHDDDEGNDLDDAERRDRAVAAALLPHGERDGSQHMGSGSDQEDRGAELAHRENEDVNPAGQQDRRQERQQDAPEDLRSEEHTSELQS